MKKKGFTLVELLVVIAIIAMLLAILMPALSKVKEMAYRMVCGTNLSGIGKAMLTYAQDYDESFPIAGGKDSMWSTDGKLGSSAWGWDKAKETPEADDPVTITASLYLLIKYGDLGPSQFICKATQDKRFDLADYPVGSKRDASCEDLKDAWDFGGKETATAGINGPWNHVSYSYHQPYSKYAAHSSSTPSLAIMADRNRSFDTSLDTTSINTIPALDIDPITGDFKTDNTEKCNSLNHGSEGQNVMYADTHVEFQKAPNVGIDEDNIYTRWDWTTGSTPTILQIQQGKVPVVGPSDTTFSIPATESDSFLVSDYVTQ